ncbi:hypothetical protein HDC92_004769 [Pedobacter sp. AK017]|uniref:major capsid protein n=1 Tax=Pedobacter sp. AK017 TaxID=2723073 RepID=UPI00161DDF5C|nr:major capsid protein [Pedobacter sp. AK017]MBB5441065.1 hypothetical protein [Pedobacter sp. AK017]
MKRELGGGRIGSGNKMEVNIEGYGRSTHNLNTTVKTTMAIGTLLPIHNSLILAGDTREIDLDAMLMTHPTEGPLFDSAKLQVDVFKIDIRLWVAKLHMNLLEKGLTMSDIKLPLIEFKANDIDWTKDPNNQQTNPSSIFRYLGINGPGQGNGTTTPMRYFNALQWLMYWDIVKNYYANKQETDGAVISAKPVITTVTEIFIRNYGEDTELPPNAGSEEIPIERATSMLIYYVGEAPDPFEIIISLEGEEAIAGEMFYSITVQPAAIILTYPKREYTHNTANFWKYIPEDAPRMPKIVNFPLKNLDDIKMDVLAAIKSTEPFIIDETSPAPFGLSLGLNGSTYRKLSSQEGLAIKTYQSDVLQNWLNTEYIDGVNGVNARSAIQIDGDGKFTIDNLLIKEKLYNYLNRIAVAGATVDDMMEVTYDVTNRTRSEIPTFEGGMSKELIFEQVISNSASEEQPLGTIAGRGKTAGHKGGRIRITNDDTQHAYYMVIASLTPRLTYTQGNKWDTNLKTYDDFHKPAFDQIGFQALLTDNMASWDTKVSGDGTPVFMEAGKQPAWTWYQTEIDRAFGNFAEQKSEGWMIFDRNYEANATTKRIKDLTTYIDPAKYNGVFAYEARDAQNIWAQFRIEDKATRKMSANQMPKM